MRTNRRRVVVVLEAPPGRLTTHPIRVMRRFRTIRQAENWIGRLKSPAAAKARHEGRYGIDAPEELTNPNR